MTPDQFKAKLRREGKTLRQWSEENGYRTEAVYRIFNGVVKGHYGRANEILRRAGVTTPSQRKAA